MNYKLRIKHPSGAEFEAEGPAEFILSEKDGFLKRLPPAENQAAVAAAQGETGQNPDWSALSEEKSGVLVLRNKHQGLTAGEAALILLAAEKQLKGGQKVTALALSKAVKISGYAPERLDRVLTRALRDGLIKASGAKRNRTYQITEKGLETAWLTARKLA